MGTEHHALFSVARIRGTLHRPALPLRLCLPGGRGHLDGLPPVAPPLGQPGRLLQPGGAHGAGGRAVERAV